MRTTLTLDDDVLNAARELADLQRRPLGEVVSDLIRHALNPPSARAPKYRNGILLLDRGDDAAPITMEMVNRLRDDAP